jgi:hypothetical protein
LQFSEKHLKLCCVVIKLSLGNFIALLRFLLFYFVLHATEVTIKRFRKGIHNLLFQLRHDYRPQTIDSGGRVRGHLLRETKGTKNSAAN